MTRQSLIFFVPFQDDGVGEGGAIFNLGRITVLGEASEFKDNVAAVRGGSLALCLCLAFAIE